MSGHSSSQSLDASSDTTGAGTGAGQSSSEPARTTSMDSREYQCLPSHHTLERYIDNSIDKSYINLTTTTGSVQFLTIVSEKQARVYHLNNCLGSQTSSPPPHGHGSNPLSAGLTSSAGGSSGVGAGSPATDQQSSSAHSSSASSSTGTVIAAGGSSGGGQSINLAQSKSSSSASSSHPIERNASSDYWPFAKLFAANNANLFSKCDLSESSFVCRSAVVQMRSPDEHCLVSYLATGNIVVHTLPKLLPQPLMDADFVPYSNPRIGASMLFSRLGHCLYQPSPNEVCKFTISAQYKSLVNDMIGTLYVPREMPEMPRPNFFKSLLSSVSGAGATSSAKQQSERDELFGELGAGKAQRGVAKHIGGSTMDRLKGAAVGTMGHEMRMAREGLDERGEKLSEVEDRTQHMMMQSEMYANAAHQLAQKFKDKKWYQF